MRHWINERVYLTRPGRRQMELASKLQGPEAAALLNGSLGPGEWAEWAEWAADLLTLSSEEKTTPAELVERLTPMGVLADAVALAHRVLEPYLQWCAVAREVQAGVDFTQAPVEDGAISAPEPQPIAD